MQRRPSRRPELQVGVFVLLAASSSCQSKTSGSVASARPDPAVPPVTEQAAQPVATRSAADGRNRDPHVELSVIPERVSLVCANDFRECSGTTTVTVHNRSPRPVGLATLHVEPRTGPRLSADYDPGPTINKMLDPGEGWTHTITFRNNAGEYEVSVNRFKSDAAPLVPINRVRVVVDNPALDQAKADCKACRGEWAHHGFGQNLGCLCRARDGGAPCDDGDDCQFGCVREPGDKRFTCAEFSSTSGCHQYLPSGWSKQTRRGQAVRIPVVCSD